MKALWAHQRISEEDTEPSLIEKNSSKAEFTSAIILGDLRRKLFRRHGDLPVRLGPFRSIRVIGVWLDHMMCLIEVYWATRRVELSFRNRSILE